MMLAPSDVKPTDLRSAVRLGPPLAPLEIARIERHLHFNCNKWDTQVGDRSTLSEQALIVAGTEWDLLCRSAEQLAAEMISMESVALQSSRYEGILGVPKPLWRLLVSKVRRAPPKTPATRAMRFDFHPTRSGWRVSEVNSDVPGGWTEASALPYLYRPFNGGLELPPRPLDAWGESMRRSADGRRVALLSAPGFLEDQQVVLALMRKLESHGIPCSLIQTPRSLDWSSDGDCSLRGAPERISAVVRFYQAEWLCNLPRFTGWEELLATSEIVVTNPMISALSESKRFPLMLRDVSGCPAWRAFVPECRDPREVAEAEWDEWVLKASFSNTGDEVYICGELPRRLRAQLVRKARHNPTKWVAQRRFETLTLESRRGLLFPCVGIFVVNGNAAGAYVRLSSQQITDGSAEEAPLYIDRMNQCT